MELDTPLLASPPRTPPRLFRSHLDDSPPSMFKPSPASPAGTPPLSPNKNGTSPYRGLRMRDANLLENSPNGATKRSPMKSRQLGIATQNLAELARSPEKYPLGRTNTFTINTEKENDLSLTLELPTKLSFSNSGLLVPSNSPLRHRRARSEDHHRPTNIDLKRTKDNVLSFGSFISKPPASSIAQFYFPKGRPEQLRHQQAKLRRVLATAREVFKKHLTVEGFATVCTVCELPRCFRTLLFDAINPTNTNGTVSFSQFERFWTDFTQAHSDEQSLAFALLVGNENDLIPQDLQPLITEIIRTHPGLEFLQNSPQFQEKYMETIMIRIFYKQDRGRRGKISLADFRKSNILATLKQVEATPDINLVTEYFSYKHFYVLFCRFWELDKDHDGLISKFEMLQFDEGAISTRVLDRIVRGCGRLDKDSTSFRGSSTVRARGRAMQMNYEDFCWFLLSEEDKTTDTAIEYWFRCLDMDNDDMLSIYELEFFLEEQLLRLRRLAVDALGFDDLLCQMLDYIHPQNRSYITLNDLKRCQLCSVFFNSIFNVNKFIYHESKDASTIRQERERPKMSDWDRFADEEYDMMAAAEAAQSELQEGLNYESEPEEDEMLF